MARKFTVAIDLGGTNLKVALLDSNYRIINKRVLNTAGFRGKAGLIQAIVSSVNGIVKGRRISKGDIAGVGLGLPGPVDSRRGIVHFFPNIPGWREVKLKKILEHRLGLAVSVDNDAKLMTLAEHRLGSAKGFDNAICLTLGTGVGGGLILEGRLYRGQDNASGEIGHLPVNEKGPACNCGGSGCLEAYIGNKKILSRARKLFGREISLEELSSLANEGNARALGIWHEVAGHLGIALAGAVNLLNPGAIVIGGGVAGAGRALFKRVKEVIMSRAMSVQAGRVKIFKAKLASDAGLIGAAIQVRESIRS